MNFLKQIAGLAASEARGNDLKDSDIIRILRIELESANNKIQDLMAENIGLKTELLRAKEVVVIEKT